MHSYRYGKNKVKPCVWAGSSCKSDKSAVVVCKKLDSLCVGSATPTPRPYPTPSPTQVPTPSPTPVPTPESIMQCKAWCQECPMNWHKKCSWHDLCGACSECTSNNYN